MSFESLCIIFTLKSFTEWQDPYNSFNIFKKQNLLKVLWCFSALSVLLACPHEGTWLDMRIFVLNQAGRHLTNQGVWFFRVLSFCWAYAFTLR